MTFRVGRLRASVLMCVAALAGAANAQASWGAALEKVAAERAALAEETRREFAARNAALDGVRRALIEELARAEAAEAAAGKLAATLEADAYAVELDERRAEAEEAEAGTWRELLARRAAELPDPARGRGVVPPPTGAAIVDAALAAADAARTAAATISLDGDVVRVGEVQRFRAAGRDRALGARADAPTEDGPFDIEGLDALRADLAAGRPATWFPCDPSGRLRPIVEADRSFAGLLRAGGPIVYVIGVLGLLACAVVVRRAIALAAAGADDAACAARAKAWLGDVAAAAAEPDLALDRLVARAEAAFLRGQTFIGAAAAVAPLLGLLGTVTGMVSTFDALTRTSGGDVRALSGGISEALITTEAGLIVAIPLLLAHAMLGARGRRLVDGTEAAGETLLGAARAGESAAR
jgi:hypothetical protein